jgi:hypothetical protein
MVKVSTQLMTGVNGLFRFQIQTTFLDLPNLIGCKVVEDEYGVLQLLRDLIGISKREFAC